MNFQSSELCDLDLALELAPKAVEMSESKNPDILSTLATIRAECNDVGGAIKAIELAKDGVHGEKYYDRPEEGLPEDT